MSPNGAFYIAAADETGAAGLVLAGNVVPLDAEPAVLAAMLEGWGRQQRARFLQDRTITARARLVRRLAEFSGQYPWQWNAAEIEAFFGSLRCGSRPAAVSTARGYQVTLRLLSPPTTHATPPSARSPPSCQPPSSPASPA